MTSKYKANKNCLCCKIALFNSRSNKMFCKNCARYLTSSASKIHYRDVKIDELKKKLNYFNMKLFKENFELKAKLKEVKK